MNRGGAGAPAADWGVARWLAYQEALHPAEMELGLDRVRAVAGALGLGAPAPLTVTVAGTNGKGSCVALLTDLLARTGRRVGSYTSPHLLRYNERICVHGSPVDDATLCAAFSAVEAARGTVGLTYFEFGTLAALWTLERARLDAAVLEVGLGGRLDAVNIVDADAALISSIDLDHQAWLGFTRDSIGAEKAGIFRARRPAVSADPATPGSIPASAAELGARYREAGRDFTIREADDGSWSWTMGRHELAGLPRPAGGRVQLRNAAGCLAVLAELGVLRALSPAQVADGLRHARAPGRLQRVGTSPEQLVDVSHNPAAGRALAEHLAGRPGSRVHAVVGMLADKDHEGYLAELAELVSWWYPATTGGARGYSAKALGAHLPAKRIAGLFDDPASAWRAALEKAAPRDRVVACGSFVTAAAVVGLKR